MSDPFSRFAPWPMELVAEGVVARSRLAARDRKEPFPRGIDLTKVAEASCSAEGQRVLNLEPSVSKFQLRIIMDVHCHQKTRLQE